MIKKNQKNDVKKRLKNWKNIVQNLGIKNVNFKHQNKVKKDKKNHLTFMRKTGYLKNIKKNQILTKI